jgi:hypothetical protein
MLASGDAPPHLYRWRASDQLRVGLFPLNFTAPTPPSANTISSSSTASSVASNDSASNSPAAGKRPAAVPSSLSAPAVVSSSPPTLSGSGSLLTPATTSSAASPASITQSARVNNAPVLTPPLVVPHKPAAGPTSKFECNRTVANGGELSEGELYRCKVIDEMINTENDFIDAMELMLRLFYEPLKANKLLDKKSLQVIFGGIPELLQLNKRLRSALLDEAGKPVGDKRMGEAFLRNSLTVAMTEPYAAYCAQHQRASDLIREAASAKTAKGAEFAAWLKDVHATAALNMRQLSSFVILPVQRVCKYPLLLKELVKRTPADHGDAEPLMRAQKAVEVLTAAVNERTKDIENQVKIAELVSRCAGLEKCNPHRYIRDGPFVDHSPVQKKGPQPCHYYLFSNCLVRAKPNKNKMRLKPLKVKEAIPIDLCVVADIDDTPTLKYAIDVSHMGTSSKYRLVAPNADAKESWLIDFEKLLAEVRAEEARLQELDRRRRASTPAAVIGAPLARATSMSKPLPSVPGTTSSGSGIRMQGRSQTVSITTDAPLSSSVWTPGSFRTSDESTGLPQRRASIGSGGKLGDWSPGSQRGNSTPLSAIAESESGPSSAPIPMPSNNRVMHKDSDDDDDLDEGSASPPAPTVSRQPSGRIFGSSKALEAHANNASQFAGAVRLQRPPTRPPPRLTRDGDMRDTPPVPSTPPPSVTSVSSHAMQAPPLPSTPPPPISNPPTIVPPPIGPQFVEEVLNGAKQVILAGKKLVLHSRELGPQDDPSDEATKTSSRELAKETYVLLSVVTAALQDVVPTTESAQLQGVAKEARGAVLELVDAAKAVRTGDAATAHLRLEEEYKKLVTSVKNIVALSQSFAEQQQQQQQQQQNQQQQN